MANAPSPGPSDGSCRIGCWGPSLRLSHGVVGHSRVDVTYYLSDSISVGTECPRAGFFPKFVSGRCPRAFCAVVNARGVVCVCVCVVCAFWNMAAAAEGRVAEVVYGIDL